jgi:pimeloyl-ACP methyl ester carboxylesterase
LLEANGLSFYVQDEGEGTPILLLHGFPDTGNLWRHQLPVLLQSGYRVIIPDLRGRGRSERPEEVSAYRLSLIAQDVGAILDRLGIDRAHVVGHDWGAAVAWRVAATMPERVSRLVAISVGAPGATSRPSLEELQKGWYRLLFLMPGVESLLQRDEWSLLRLFLREASDVESYIRTLSEPGALTAGLNWYRANLSLDALGARATRAPMIRARTMGIWSSGDAYLTEEAMTGSAQRVSGGWRYERLPGSHWIPLDQAESLNQLLLEFLAP